MMKPLNYVSLYSLAWLILLTMLEKRESMDYIWWNVGFAYFALASLGFGDSVFQSKGKSVVFSHTAIALARQ